LPSHAADELVKHNKNPPQLISAVNAQVRSVGGQSADTSHLEAV
jgi:hypothetical protein